MRNHEAFDEVVHAARHYRLADASQIEALQHYSMQDYVCALRCLEGDDTDWAVGLRMDILARCNSKADRDALFKNFFLPVAVRVLGNSSPKSKDYSRWIGKLGYHASLMLMEQDLEPLEHSRAILLDACVPLEYHDDPLPLLPLRLANRSYMCHGMRGARPQQYSVLQKGARFADWLTAMGLGDEVEKARPTMRMLTDTGSGHVIRLAEVDLAWNPWADVEKSLTDAMRLYRLNRITEAAETLDGAMRLVRATPLLQYRMHEIIVLRSQIG
eukprot:UN0882